MEHTSQHSRYGLWRGRSRWVLGLLIALVLCAPLLGSHPQPANAGTSCLGYRIGDLLGSGNIPVTSESGTLVSGLIIGAWYAIEPSNGPWDPHWGTGPAQYGAWVSNNGSTWYRLNQGVDGSDFVYAWGAAAEPVNTYYRRGYWQATTSSIRIRVGDAAGKFADNVGTLRWNLYWAAPCSSGG